MTNSIVYPSPLYSFGDLFFHKVDEKELFDGLAVYIASTKLPDVIDYAYFLMACTSYKHYDLPLIEAAFSHFSPSFKLNNLNMTDAHYYHLLESVIYDQQLDVFRYLVEKKFFTVTHETFISAVKGNCTEIAAFVLDMGMNEHLNNKELLKHAIEEKNLSLVQLIVERGADYSHYIVDMTNEDLVGLPVLDTSSEVAEYMVGLGANIHLYSPVSMKIALDKDNRELVFYFLEQGCSIEIVREHYNPYFQDWLKTKDSYDFLNKSLTNKSSVKSNIKPSIHQEYRKKI